MSACAQPIPFETLVAYWADELSPDEVDHVDDHLFGCATCTAASASIARMAEAIRDMIPPVVSTAMVTALRARGVKIRENTLRPGERREAIFGENDEVLLHRLGGLDLSGVERVTVTVLVEGTGDVLYVDPAAPFQEDAGEVLIACQRHFAAFPPNVVFEVRARARSGEERVTTFAVPHVFG